MAKIAPTSIKYIIYAKFESTGAVEKPDVIGAIFGQTEGLLGDELEMRELQKQGKIGRIEVELSLEDGKTIGEIEIPSAMDKNETSLVAAAIETIEKIGPGETKIKIEKIDDVRGSKRDFILERAKQLLGGMSNGGSSEMNLKEIGREMGESARVAGKLKTYGTENLPCGDLSGEELTIVEGRADVVNMLRQGVNNVICMNGVKLPETIKELSKEKIVTLFVDGDRGGKLIIKNVTENANVNFIAIAPEGKEVEELTSKEILQALRRKVTVKEYFQYEGKGRRFVRREEEEPVKAKKEISHEKLTEKEKDIVKNAIDELIGTKAAILFNKKMEIIRKIPLSRLGYFKFEEPIHVLAINDTATPGIIRAAEEMGIGNLAAKNFTTTNTSINLISI
ncbi:MAG: DNA primase DnaG [archaeon]|nr:DNA primase DnaG [archaeon]